MKKEPILHPDESQAKIQSRGFAILHIISMCMTVIVTIGALILLEPILFVVAFVWMLASIVFKVVAARFKAKAQTLRKQRHVSTYACTNNKSPEE